MKNSKRLFQDFIKQISLNESAEECASIGRIVFADLFGLSGTDILSEKLITLSADDHIRLTGIIHRINKHEPVQYILGNTEFFGRKFNVSPSVLIPRPETEELVQHVLLSLQHLRQKKKEIKIFDIGTGSGCIAVTLALEISQSKVHATDVNAGALVVAKKNAELLKASVSFLQHDILKSEIPFNDLDVVVSNPPYITLQEESEMKKNVVDYEPHLALFVEGDDPLLFYKAIATKAKKVLSHKGILVVEINEKFGNAVSRVFAGSGFQNITVIKDLQGKDRIVSGSLI